MRFSFSRQSESQDLLTSQLFDQNAFYQKFLKDIARCHSELIVESPFMTARRVAYLLPSFSKLIGRGCKVIVNTKHPDEQEDNLRSEAIAALRLLTHVGVKVVFTGGHHRKIAIIDRVVLWEGSLNILSQNDSCEIMRRIDSPILSQQMVKFLGLERLVRG